MHMNHLQLKHFTECKPCWYACLDGLVCNEIVMHSVFKSNATNSKFDSQSIVYSLDARIYDDNRIYALPFKKSFDMAQ